MESTSKPDHNFDSHFYHCANVSRQGGLETGKRNGKRM